MTEFLAEFFSDIYNAGRKEKSFCVGDDSMKSIILPDLLNSEWASRSEMLSDFKKTPYYTQLMHTCKTLNRSVIYESELHGVDHIERVILLGALIAWKISLSDADTQLLMAACSYHDIGRIDDSVDDEHGRRSAEMLRDLSILPPSLFTDDELQILYAIITVHSMSDTLKVDVAEKYHIPTWQMDRYLELMACLKDADNLDRVRVDDLDVSHLRHQISVDLAPFAKSLYARYIHIQYS